MNRTILDQAPPQNCCVAILRPPTASLAEGSSFGNISPLSNRHPDPTGQRAGLLEAYAYTNVHLHQFGYQLLIYLDEDPDPQEAYRRISRWETVKGFLILNPQKGDERIQYLQEHQIPFIAHGRAEAQPDYPLYDVNHWSIGYQSANHLLHQGHREIALFPGSSDSFAAVERIRGFKTAMAEQGVGVHPDWIVANATLERSAQQAADWLLRGKRRPTAIICPNTVTAAGVFQAAKQRGWEIPGDLSVVAHDEGLAFAQAEAFDPPLTGTRLPLRWASKPLSSLLLNLLEGHTSRLRPYLDEPEWVERDSCAPPSTSPPLGSRPNSLSTLRRGLGSSRSDNSETPLSMRKPGVLPTFYGAAATNRSNSSGAMNWG